MAKGQTAMEYLMTYGWAILIVIVVGGVLWYYGVFTPGKLVGPTATGFSNVKVLSPWSLAGADGAMTLRLENRVGEDITVTGITAVSACTALTPASLPLAAGERGSISAVCGGVTGTAGNAYNIDVKITYTVAGTSFTETGTLTGTYS